MECNWCKSEIHEEAKVCKFCNRVQIKLLGIISTWSVLEILGLLLTVFSTVVAYSQATKATNALAEIQVLRAHVYRSNLKNIVDDLKSDRITVTYTCAPAQLDRNSCSRRRVWFFYRAANRIVDIENLEVPSNSGLEIDNTNTVEEICGILRNFEENVGEIPNVHTVPLKAILMREFGVETINNSALQQLSICY